MFIVLELNLTCNGAVLIGDVRNNGGGDHPDRLQDDCVGVGHQVSVLQSEGASSIASGGVGLLPDPLLHLRPGGDERQSLDQQVGHGRVTSDDIFKGKHGRVESEQLFLVLVLNVLQQSLDVVARLFLGHQTLATPGQPVVDDGLLHEAPDLMAPLLHLGHVLAVEGHQPGQEVGGATLVHLVEDGVEVLNGGVEGDVVAVEFLCAEVGGEDVGAGVQQLGFDGHLGAGGRVQTGGQVTHLVGHQGVELTESGGERLREGVAAEHFTTQLLHVGPVAECESCKNLANLVN